MNGNISNFNALLPGRIKLWFKTIRYCCMFTKNISYKCLFDL